MDEITIPPQEKVSKMEPSPFFSAAPLLYQKGPLKKVVPCP